MRILADYHHDMLFHSLQILFQQRLGWQVYRPLGMEWYYEGYWRYSDNIEIVRQFLGLECAVELTQVKKTLNETRQAANDKVFFNDYTIGTSDGIYIIRTNEPNIGVSLTRAKEIEFDIILSSVTQHFQSFEKFRWQYQPKAKHIHQMGNNGPVPAGCKNLLNSTSVTPPPGVNHVRYHQEFSLDRFKPGPCPNPHSVANLMHHQRWEKQFFELADQLPSWRFMSWGAGNHHGVVTWDIADAIRDNGFIWHVKPSGDGYGYNIHNSYACGRPVIVRYDWIKNTTAEVLCIPSETCIDIGQHWIPARVADQLKHAVINWGEMSEAAHQQFKKVVDFDAEFEQIKVFLENLQ